MYNFEKLDVYQKARRLVREVYSITGKYPKNEQFVLVPQTRRAVISITLNIAEGSIKTKKEFARFIDISLGSLLELEALFQISQDLGYLNEEDFRKISEGLQELYKMLVSLKSYLKKRP